MNIENLFTKDTTVKITVLKIENKKFTKGIFNQLHISSPFDKLYNLKENVKFLGYINDKTRWIIWTNGNSLFKYDVKEFYPLRFLNLNSDKIKDLIQIYPNEEVKSLYTAMDQGYYEYRDSQISTVLDVKIQYEIIDKKEKVDKILTEVLKRQIYL
jgi:hypothetical protein